MAKRVTQSNRLLFHIDASMHQALLQLGWSEEGYREHQLRCAVIYLVEITGNNEAKIKEIGTHRVFGGWWRLHWYHREQQWLAMAEEMKWPLQVRRFQYRAIHNAHDLAAGKSRDGQVLEDSYSRDVVPNLK